MSDTNGSKHNIIETALAAGIAQNCIVTKNDVKFALIPEGYKLEDLEQFDTAPRKLKAAPVFASLDSFTAYVKEFQEDRTRIFANSDTGHLLARLDYHEAGEPSWNTHSASYHPKQTEEWKRWLAQDNKYMSQGDFAEFIESNIQDITKPEGATMLEIAKTFEAKTSTEFKSGIRLDNGNQKLTFAQDTTAKAGASLELEIPSEFDLALTPFAFGEAYPVKARLRYRINDKKELVLKYQLINPHKVIEALVLRLIDKVAEDLEIRPLIGG